MFFLHKKLYFFNKNWSETWKGSPTARGNPTGNHLPKVGQAQAPGNRGRQIAAASVAASGVGRPHTGAAPPPSAATFAVEPALVAAPDGAVVRSGAVWLWVVLRRRNFEKAWKENKNVQLFLSS